MNRHRKMLTGCVVKPHFVLFHAQVLRIRKAKWLSSNLELLEQLSFKVGYQEFQGTTGSAMRARIA